MTPPSGRNNALTSIAGKLRAQGLEEDEILQCLLSDAARNGLPESEVRDIARSIGRKPKGRKLKVSETGWPSPLHQLAAVRGWKVEALQALGATEGGNGREVLFPMLDAAGEITGYRRRRADGTMFGNGKKSLARKGDKAGLMMTFPLPEEETVFIVEGEADACAAFSAGAKAVVATPGAQPGVIALGYLQPLIAGRKVVLAPDPDGDGEKWRDMVGAALRAAQCDVRFIPPLPGLDLDKRLARMPEAEREAWLKKQVEDALEWKPPPVPAEELSFRLLYTDFGNAERLAKRCKGRFLYAADVKQWFWWDGKRWTPTGADVALEREAKEFVKELARLGEKVTDDEDKRNTMLRWAKRCGDIARIQAMIKLLRSAGNNCLCCKLSDFDLDRWKLNCANGELDLRTGQLTPHHSSQRNTRVLEVPFDLNAKCPLWEKTLQEIFEGKKSVISFLRRLLGYALSGSVKKHLIVIFYGSGRNGKGLIAETMGHLLGDYATKVQSTLFIDNGRDRGADESSPSKFGLRGARFAFGSESREGARLAEASLKELSGGDSIRARDLYGKAVTIRPTWKLFLLTNKKPMISQDSAVWSRLRLIPFNACFEGSEDEDLPVKLEAEFAGILKWAVEGCREFLENGLQEPREIIAAMNDFRSHKDLLGQFLSECTRKGPDLSIAARDLYGHFRQWREELGLSPTSEVRFASEMAAAGIEKVRKAQGFTYQGLEMISHTSGMPNSMQGSVGSERSLESKKPNDSHVFVGNVGMQGSAEVSKTIKNGGSILSTKPCIPTNPTSLNQEVDYEAEERKGIQEYGG